MKNAKLLLLLRHLDTRERTRFGSYIHSPFFNKHPHIKQLGDYLLALAPDFPEERLHKENVFYQLHPKETYNEDRMNNLLSELLQLLYGFLTQLQIEQRPVWQQQLLTEELFQREEEKHNRWALRRLDQMVQREKSRTSNFYDRQTRLHALLDQHELERGKRRFNKHLQLESDSLDLYYFIEKFRLACDMTSRNIVINADYDCQMLEDLLQLYHSEEPLRCNDVLRVYHKTLQMLKGEEGNFHFDELKDLLRRYGVLFPKEELRTLYYYALNFCIRRINSGESRFYKETLGLYNVMLEEEIILNNGVLSQWSYKNIVTTGLRLKEFDWTDQFIHKYKRKLLPEEQFNAFTYNLASLYYAKGNYQEALLQLQDVEFTDTSYHLGAKIIQLKSYYELEETEPLFDLIDAFSQYVRRNRQISDYRKKANNNFLKLTRQLTRLKTEFGTLADSKRSKKVQQLKTRITQTEPVANKEWLLNNLEKVD